jgi:hypothetical protein
VSKIYKFYCKFSFSYLAPVPTAYDPADYYFVGALIALSCAIFSAANNIVISLVSKSIIGYSLRLYQRILKNQ